MDTRMGLLFLVLLLVSCMHCNGKSLGTSDTEVLETASSSETKYGDEYERNRMLCAFCEHLAEQAVGYLKENKTQTEILEIFHQVCLRLPSFKQQCVMLVDFYAPAFFLQVSSVHPDDFCRRISICEESAPPPHPPAPSSPPSPPSSLQFQDPPNGEHICDFCHNAIFRVLSKLKDPGTELRIVERLVKGCVMAERFADQCQTLVFQYGPVILVNVVRLLERADLCVSLHACQGNRNETVVPYAASAALPVHDM